MFIKTIVVSVRSLEKRLATIILKRSTIKYVNKTIEKNKIKPVEFASPAGAKAEVAANQYIKTPTLIMLRANPFTASPI